MSEKNTIHVGPTICWATFSIIGFGSTIGCALWFQSMWGEDAAFITAFFGPLFWLVVLSMWFGSKGHPIKWVLSHRWRW